MTAVVAWRDLPRHGQGCQAHQSGEDRSPGGGLAPLLIVEDSWSSAALLRQVFDHLLLANPVVHLTDGERAVEWLDVPTRRPALMVLDVQLPGRDGMDILRRVRSLDHLQGVPVLMLTATADRADLEEAYALGADSYLVKPVGFEALEDVLRHLPLRWALLPTAHDA